MITPAAMKSVVICPELSTVSIPNPNILGMIKLKIVLAVRQTKASTHIAQCLFKNVTKRIVIFIYMNLNKYNKIG